MSNQRGCDLRAKAERARRMADICGDIQLAANLRNYARELDGEASREPDEPSEGTEARETD